APIRINPLKDKTIIHLNTFLPDVDANYDPQVIIIDDITVALQGLHAAHEAAMDEATMGDQRVVNAALIRGLLRDELQSGQKRDDLPLKPQRVVADIRAALGDEDIVLADTGAIKMWMARLYPTYSPLSCIVSNGLSTMAFALPGAIGAHLACPDKKIL